jgi:hypothetical protein
MIKTACRRRTATGSRIATLVSDGVPAYGGAWESASPRPTSQVSPVSSGRCRPRPSLRTSAQIDYHRRSNKSCSVAVAPEATIELKSKYVFSVTWQCDRRLLIAKRDPYVGVGLRLALYESIAGLRPDIFVIVSASSEMRAIFSSRVTFLGSAVT